MIKLILLLFLSGSVLAGEKLDADILFDWAEKNYQNLFPSNQPSLDYDLWYYRFYKSKNIYLGLKTDDSDIYVLGDERGGLTKVGALNELMKLVSTFDPTVAPVITGNWYKPDVNISWQWQLQGDVNTSYNVDVYDIDLFNSSISLIQSLQSDGKKVICYFSAGSWENWRADKSDFPMEVIGETLDGWEDEKWLDIRNEKLAPIMKSRLDLAVEKGCDGVEPDLMAGYDNNTGFPLTPTDQLAYNKFIANEARKRGLSVALKNDMEQIEELEPYFDFSVNEECHQYNECDKIQPFINAKKPVLNAEYLQKYIDNENERNKMCFDTKALGFKTLVLPLELDDSLRYVCD